MGELLTIANCGWTALERAHFLPTRRFALLHAGPKKLGPCEPIALPSFLRSAQNAIQSFVGIRYAEKHAVRHDGCGTRYLAVI